MSVPEKKQLLEKINNLHLRLGLSIKLEIDKEKSKISSIEKSMNNVTYILSDFNQRYDILMIKFPSILTSYLQKKRENLLRLNLSTVDKKNFLKDISARRIYLDKINKSINQFVINNFDKKNTQLVNLFKIHKSLSYRRTLARGYSIIRDNKKNLITNKTSALEAKELKIEFNEDILDVEVKFDK